MTDKKTYVLDTNVLLSDPSSIYAFQEHNLIIPMAVLEELDRHKGRPDDVGRNARQVGRSLDDMRSAGGSLIKGVGLPGGGVLQIVSINSGSLERLPPELREPKVDNLIIALVKQLSSGQIPGILVSKDINVRIKCDSLGLKCEDYRKMRVTEDAQKFYRGVDVIELDEELIDYFFRNGKLELPQQVLAGRKLYPNQIVVIKHVKDGQTTKSALTK